MINLNLLSSEGIELVKMLTVKSTEVKNRVYITGDNNSGKTIMSHLEMYRLLCINKNLKICYISPSVGFSAHYKLKYLVKGDLEVLNSITYLGANHDSELEHLELENFDFVVVDIDQDIDDNLLSKLEKKYPKIKFILAQYNE